MQNTRQNQENNTSKENQKFNREIETTKKKSQTEILEPKNTMSQVKKRIESLIEESVK